jgi:hypothetical protein
LACPIPEPVALVTEIHATLLTAVHEHCVPEVTDTALAPPVAATFALSGVTE